MKKLAIFDFDGTIMDSVHDVVIYLNKALSMYDFPTLTSDEYVKYLGGNIDEIVSLVLEEQSTPENIKLIKDTYLDIYYGADKENTIPFPKSREVLQKLQDRGVLIAINSNRFTDSIETFTDKFFGDINFLSIMGHDFDYPSKPDPTAVLQIIKKANVAPDETVYIGDSGTDIQTAKNAGIDCIVVKWGYGNENDWENDYPLEAIDDFDEIIKYF
ncbi:MAG: HAD family hydrolase [Methanobrevibacter sp.]|uniref:HAD family hydrolase n=1 Tax=Methanobrevibacter sp. TaxID=66852 RepID=UPI0025CBD2DF|nr:HAD family hydrolase [Methanobrevibacter sp.]MBQ8017078.1 HAD family hydrolase [Methanobrevibacter sp.]